MRETIRSLLEVHLSDPDERRRSYLLNILLFGFCALSVVAAIFSILFLIFGDPTQHGAFLLILASVGVFILGTVLIYTLNKRGKGTLSNVIFLIILTIAISVGDKPAEVFGGRSLYFFMLPIILASMLLRPYASFIAAGLISCLFLGSVLVLNIETNLFVGPLGFFAVAFLSWLSSNSLETALKEVRLANQELDQRVMQRTRELAEANQQLSQANEQLKGLDQLKSRFVSDVSHELRTPISNLRIYMEMLRSGKVEKQAQYLDVLQEETTRLSRLVEDVLDLSRLELGTKKTEFAWVDINQIVETIVLASQIRAKAKDLILEFEKGSDLPPIWADANQTKQVVNNLLGNALNYTPRGKIDVMTGFDAEHQQVWFRVTDTGVGILPEDLPNIFERFYRGHQVSQSNIRGSGLGLAITREIVDAHRGFIDVESKPGIGSTFTVRLPLNKETTQAAA